MDTNLPPDLPLLRAPQDSNSSQNHKNPKQDQSNEDEEGLIQVKQARQKEALLAQLKKFPIIHTSCEKIGIGRATYYRWIKDDEIFRDQALEAIHEGRMFMNDMAETQLLGLVHEQSFAATAFWLKHNHPVYKNRLEVTGKIATNEKTDLSPEQKQAIEDALRLSTTGDNSPPLTPENDESNSTESETNDPQ